MNKKLLLLIPALLLGACNGTQGGGSSEDTPYVEETTRTLLFMTNNDHDSVDLPTGNPSNGENILHESITVEDGETIKFPLTTPTKSGYDFSYWAFDRKGVEPVVSDYVVHSNLVIYAQYVRSQEEEKEEYKEVKLEWKESVVDSLSTPIQVDGVLNEFISSGVVKLTTIGIRKLNENKDDLKKLINYSRRSTTIIVSMKYESNKVKIVYSVSGVESTIEIEVIDITSTLTVESTYETKALKYEANSDIAPYNIVLAGSSSMENWSTSTEDMKPLTSVNVGIGGTRFEHWSEKLSSRLIYAFNPRAVVFYLGINNIINAYNTGTETGNGIVQVIENVHTHLPDATVYFVLVNYVPGYMQWKSHIDDCNNIVLAHEQTHSYVKTINPGKSLLKEDGTPNHAYFLSDGLHMTMAGYVIWGGIVKQTIMSHENEIYKK